MADTKISALTGVSSVAGANEFAVNEAGVSKKATASQIKTFVTTAPSFAAGSASANSWPEWNSGTILTAAEAGAVEFDGKAFYATCVNSARQVMRNEQFLTLSATQTATSGSGAQTWFPGGGATGVTLQGSTSYFFEGTLHLANGTTTHTTALLFPGSGGLTYTSIKYLFMISSVAENAVGAAPSMGAVNVATSTVLNATSTAAGAHIWVEGIMRINVGGTMSPQFQWSANPTGTNQVLLNTRFRIYPIGSNTVLSVGQWA